MTLMKTKYAIGQLVHHCLFDYRGVVVDADPVFKLDDEWYTRMARSGPPRDEPWYRILVHETDEITYVAERNLELDGSGEPVDHPLLGSFFNEFRGGYYSDTRCVN